MSATTSSPPHGSPVRIITARVRKNGQSVIVTKEADGRTSTVLADVGLLPGASAAVATRAEDEDAVVLPPENDMEENNDDEEQEAQDVLCDDEEIFAEDIGGTDEERSFARIIGTIEDLMVSDAVGDHRSEFFASLPPVERVGSDHERHLLFKKYLGEVDGLLEAHLSSSLPDQSADAIAQVVEARQAEVSEDVWEFVSGACLDYQQFVALWTEDSLSKPKA